MRESNFRSVQSNRASVSITTTLYDRRALDCTSDKPLANSLNHLAYLTSSSARVRETLCVDGGLERLVAILKDCRHTGARNPSLVAWKWTLALQCLMFLGTRGSEKVRRRVVEAGCVPVIATVLDNYLEISSSSSSSSLCADLSSSSSSLSDGGESVSASSGPDAPDGSGGGGASGGGATPLYSTSTGEVIMRSVSPESVPAAAADNVVLEMSVVNNAIESTTAYDEQHAHEQHPNPRRRFMPHQQLTLEPGPYAHECVIVPREDDVLWALEILGFVSKYAHLKPSLQQSHLVPQLSLRDPRAPPLFITNDAYDDHDHNHNHNHDDDYWNYDEYDFESEHRDLDDEYLGETINIFPLVEKFTVKHFPKEMQYWAGVIMRNCCRKDESKGGIRQCANFDCGRWEEYPRQFAKCRRCKRTKYCGKDCQLKAWTYHRHWCHPSNASSSSSTSTSRSVDANTTTTSTTTTNSTATATTATSTSPRV
ncbi:hypothetical protein TRICI_003725 [Trichomonascus ciferrii]|uniref:MYND-type domain-containing protein n=1 Tax=Trichomonascus ciferrii TaxID=44093 RepID=A0A642V356_9ASCO|nr:hypothetical protein TRICI_003725 [Trichomonascus ciferrii]